MQRYYQFFNIQIFRDFFLFFCNFFYLCTRRRQNSMRFKKTISLSFLLFANIILLVHTVLFHHHDSQISAAFCAESQKYQCVANAHKCHCTESGHTCPGAGSAHKCCTIDNCLLNDFITKVNGFKLSEPFFNKIDIIIHNTATCPTLRIADLTGLPFLQKPYLPHIYDAFISQSSGLRAPPAC